MVTASMGQTEKEKCRNSNISEQNLTEWSILKLLEFDTYFDQGLKYSDSLFLPPLHMNHLCNRHNTLSQLTV